MILFRSILFYAGYSLFTVLWASLSLLCAWMLPYRLRFFFIIGAWTRVALFWLRAICGIHIRVHGVQNIPARPCVVFCKHQSTFETLFLQTLFSPQSTVIKKELLQIPFFGWAFGLLRPIAIDRSQPRHALRQLVTQGDSKLREGVWVVLFPEGSRRPVGEKALFHRGGAILAKRAGVPLLPVTHNAGSYWPPHSIRKKPGTIEVHIGKVIETSQASAAEITAKAKSWIDHQTEELESKIIHPDAPQIGRSPQ